MGSFKRKRTKINISLVHFFSGAISLCSLTLFVLAWSTKPSFVSLRRKVARITSSNVRFPPHEAGNSTFIHNYFMNLALDEAKEAGRKGEVPIGALIVERNDDDEGSYRILSRGYNMVETTHDATAHAEMNALRRASKRLNNWRLFNKTLYSTMEPCPVCLSSAQAFRIHTVVYGAPQVRLGAIESYMRMLDDYTHPFHVIEEVIPGVMKEECAELLKSFFRKKRKEKPRVPMSEYITVKKPFLSRLRRQKTKS
jgi:tRNA(adenine34) deaminase